MIKLTKCGCKVCEKKADKLLKRVNEVVNRYPQKKTCPESHKIVA